MNFARNLMKFKTVKIKDTAVTVSMDTLKNANQNLLSELENVRAQLAQSYDEMNKVKAENAQLAEDLKKKAQNSTQIVNEINSEIKTIEASNKNKASDLSS